MDAIDLYENQGYNSRLYILDNNLEISRNQGQKLGFHFSAYLNKMIYFYFQESTDFAFRMA